MPSFRAKLRDITNRKGREDCESPLRTPESELTEIFLKVPQLEYRPPPLRQISHGDAKDTIVHLKASSSPKLRPPSIPPRRQSSLHLESLDNDHTGPIAVRSAEAAFVSTYPQYRATEELDRIRQLYYQRLDLNGQIYLDYTGDLYPSHLIDWHRDLLVNGVFGNPHSDSPASACSTNLEIDARRAVLAFLDADPEVYEVIFTPNATGGLKVISENYAFADRTLVTMLDAHNSVNGMACTAKRSGAKVHAVKLNDEDSTLDEAELQHHLRNTTGTSCPGLVMFTGQSNVTGAKVRSWWFALARHNGWDIGLDASALAPTTPISLRDNPVDFLVLSVYKIIGYPTGVGALVVSRRSRRSLVRKTFAGGTINAIDMASGSFEFTDSHAAFEDGTINYLALPAVAKGLDFVAPLVTTISRRCQALVEYLWITLPTIRYNDQHATPLIQLRGPPPGAERGATISMLFSRPGHSPILPEAYRFIVWAAAQRKISVRGAPCLCNPGAAASVTRGVGHEDWRNTKYTESGIIRISFGIASNFADCFAFVNFCRELADLATYDKERTAWSSR